MLTTLFQLIFLLPVLVFSFRCSNLQSVTNRINFDQASTLVTMTKNKSALSSKQTLKQTDNPPKSFAFMSLLLELFCA